MSLSLIPAYGRDYKSKAAVQADFDADKDFAVATLGSNGYTNRSDLIRMGVKTVNIRYKKLQNVAVIKVS